VNFDGFSAQEKTDYKQAIPFSSGPVNTLTAQEAYNQVMTHGGASLKRDAVDTRLVSDVQNGTGSIIDSQDDVGGWPELLSKEPQPDTDQDGMPDQWETENGLNPNDPEDRNDDANLDGYTNLEEYLNSITFDPGITFVETDNPLLKKYILSQNYPNPFNPETEITFNLAEAGQTLLSVYDTLGQQVEVLVNKRMVPGNYRVTFNAGELPSGIYYYRIQSGAFSQVKKMMLIK